jgi:hypothetical protein
LQSCLAEDAITAIENTVTIAGFPHAINRNVAKSETNEGVPLAGLQRTACSHFRAGPPPTAVARVGCGVTNRARVIVPDQASVTSNTTFEIGGLGHVFGDEQGFLVGPGEFTNTGELRWRNGAIQNLVKLTNRTLVFLRRTEFPICPRLHGLL